MLLAPADRPRPRHAILIASLSFSKASAWASRREVVSLLPGLPRTLAGTHLILREPGQKILDCQALTGTMNTCVYVACLHFDDGCFLQKRQGGGP